MHLDKQKRGGGRWIETALRQIPFPFTLFSCFPPSATFPSSSHCRYTFFLHKLFPFQSLFSFPTKEIHRLQFVCTLWFKPYCFRKLPEIFDSLSLSCLICAPQGLSHAAFHVGKEQQMN